MPLSEIPNSNISIPKIAPTKNDLNSLNYDLMINNQINIMTGFYKTIKECNAVTKSLLENKENNIETLFNNYNKIKLSKKDTLNIKYKEYNNSDNKDKEYFSKWSMYIEDERVEYFELINNIFERLLSDLIYY